MSTVQQDVAAEVRAHLARHGRSGRSMAAQLGWQQKYLSRRLTGKVPFDVNDLDAIADALGVPVVAFFAWPLSGNSAPYEEAGQLRKQLHAHSGLRELALVA